jgi:hypothetical protein
MEPVTGQNALERGLHVLERLNDPELVEAYRAYTQRLETLVGRDNLWTPTPKSTSVTGDNSLSRPAEHH